MPYYYRAKQVSKRMLLQPYWPQTSFLIYVWYHVTSSQNTCCVYDSSYLSLIISTRTVFELRSVIHILCFWNKCFSLKLSMFDLQLKRFNKSDYFTLLEASNIAVRQRRSCIYLFRFGFCALKMILSTMVTYFRYSIILVWMWEMSKTHSSAYFKEFDALIAAVLERRRH